MLGIVIHCIQHSQAMLERGVCELAHSSFHYGQRYATSDIHDHDVQDMHIGPRNIQTLYMNENDSVQHGTLAIIVL